MQGSCSWWNEAVRHKPAFQWARQASTLGSAAYLRLNKFATNLGLELNKHSVSVYGNLSADDVGDLFLVDRSGQTPVSTSVGEVGI